MKRALKITQIIGIIIMAILFIRAGLLNIIRVSDFHFIVLWNISFVFSLIAILLYPIYVYMKSTDIHSIKESIIKYIKDIKNWVNN